MYTEENKTIIIIIIINGSWLISVFSKFYIQKGKCKHWN